MTPSYVFADAISTKPSAEGRSVPQSVFKASMGGKESIEFVSNGGVNVRYAVEKVPGLQVFDQEIHWSLVPDYAWLPPKDSGIPAGRSGVY